MPVIEIAKPKISKKQFTVREVYEAFEKNGLTHLRGTWVTEEEIYSEDGDGMLLDQNTSGGCLLTQGAWNLNSIPNESHSFTEQNIQHATSYQRRKYNEYGWQHNLRNQLNRVGRGMNNSGYDTPLGDALIDWNDAQDGLGNYRLPTYADVLAKAKELLEPHFEEKIILLVIK